MKELAKKQIQKRSKDRVEKEGGYKYIINRFAGRRSPTNTTTKSSMEKKPLEITVVKTAFRSLLETLGDFNRNRFSEQKAHQARRQKWGNRSRVLSVNLGGVHSI